MTSKLRIVLLIALPVIAAAATAIAGLVEEVEPITKGTS